MTPASASGWLLDRVWATVIASVVVSAMLTTALSLALSGRGPGAEGLTISTVIAALISGPATHQRNRHLRAVRAVKAELEVRVAEVEALSRELAAQALRDPLTGLFNRRGLRELAPTLLARASRAGTPVALALLDIDDFKSVNDRHGHVIGDAVLADLARHLTRELRGGDVVCRYGGEEFAVLMPDVDVQSASLRIEAVRRAWVVPSCCDAMRPTLSAGVASTPTHASDLDGLVRYADRALYRAKEAGRDRVVIAALPV